MSRIIAIANSKGGVGKTTTAVNLGHGLAMLGIDTLLVDLDSQGHVCASLGLDRTDGLYRAMIGGASLAEVVMPSGREHLDVLPGDKSTAGIKTILAGEDYRERRLAETLRLMCDEYPVILLDCGPSLDILNVNAIYAADSFILPVKCDYLAIDGLSQYIESLQKQIGMTGREMAGRVLIVPTLFDRVSNESRRWLIELQSLAAATGIDIAAPIPADTKVREASSAGKTTFEYVAADKAAAAYAALLTTVMESVK